MKLKALITDAYGGRGGIAKFNRDLLSALAADARVQQVTALPRHQPDPAGDLPTKIHWRGRAAGGKARYALSLAHEKLLGGTADVVLCGHINLLPLAARLKKAGQPLVLIIHGIDAWQPPKSARAAELAKSVDLVVSVSEITFERFQNWSGLPKERFFHLPNTIDLSAFTPGEKPQELIERYRAKDKKVLFTLARMTALHPGKGFEEVLRALPQLRQTHPNLLYIAAGDGDLRPKLEALAEDLGVADICRFPGYLDEAEKAAHYRLADGFALPSRGEGFGIVYLEALACGCPTLGSGSDGGREALLDGKLGILTDPTNQTRLTHDLMTLLEQPRGVPVGLETFSIAAFNGRVGNLVSRLGG